MAATQRWLGRVARYARAAMQDWLTQRIPILMTHRTTFYRDRARELAREDFARSRRAAAEPGHERSGRADRLNGDAETRQQEQNGSRHRGRQGMTSGINYPPLPIPTPCSPCHLFPYISLNTSSGACALLMSWCECR